MNGDELRKHFGHRVRILRRMRDLTQTQLAELTTYSTEYISRLERGVGSPSFDTIAAIAAALHTEPLELFRFSGSSEEH
jgi:transcriptional regulator with XRE-family HTH domain